jgi:hypothetical protein
VAVDVSVAVDVPVTMVVAVMVAVDVIGSVAVVAMVDVATCCAGLADAVERSMVPNAASMATSTKPRALNNQRLPTMG